MNIKPKEHPIILAARKEWPPVFALTELDRLSGGALRRRTINNMRYKNEIPPECFANDGRRKVLVLRDALLDWWDIRLNQGC